MPRYISWKLRWWRGWDVMRPWGCWATTTPRSRRPCMATWCCSERARSQPSGTLTACTHRRSRWRRVTTAPCAFIGAPSAARCWAGATWSSSGRGTSTSRSSPPGEGCGGLDSRAPRSGRLAIVAGGGSPTAKSIRCNCGDRADLQERPGHRQASNTCSGDERGCSGAGEPRSDRAVGRGHVGIGRNKYRPRNDVGERRPGGAQHRLDVVDGPHRLGRRVMAGDDLASLVHAVLAADVDRRRPRGNYGSMAKGRAPHEATGLQVSNLRGCSLPADTDKTRACIDYTHLP